MVKRQWTCDQIERTFNKAVDTETHQRLAETLELLLASSSQPPVSSAFSKNHLFFHTRLAVHKQRKDEL
jgi:hypothetical protein